MKSPLACVQTGIYEWSLFRKHAAASLAMGTLTAKMPLMSQKVRDFTDVLGHLGELKAPVDVSEVRVGQLAVQHTTRQCFLWLVS